MTNEEKQEYRDYLRNEIRFYLLERLPAERAYLREAEKLGSTRLIQLALHNIENANRNAAALRMELEEL